MGNKSCWPAGRLIFLGSRQVSTFRPVRLTTRSVCVIGGPCVAMIKVLPRRVRSKQNIKTLSPVSESGCRSAHQLTSVGLCANALEMRPLLFSPEDLSGKCVHGRPCPHKRRSERPRPLSSERETPASSWGSHQYGKSGNQVERVNDANAIAPDNVGLARFLSDSEPVGNDVTCGAAFHATDEVQQSAYHFHFAPAWRGSPQARRIER